MRDMPSGRGSALEAGDELLSEKSPDENETHSRNKKIFSRSG
jgi:hypothetical protein